MTTLIGILVAIIAFLFICIIAVASIYNKLVALKNYVKEAFSTMDVYLKKRWDLIPNLIETAKGYMTHEKETLEKITTLRNLNYEMLKNKQKMDVNKELSLGLSTLIATAENYPELKANEHFTNLMNELSKIEDEIANSRKYYNGTVREYNTFIQMFPTCIFAAMFNFTQEEMFEAGEIERQNVKVQF